MTAHAAGDDEPDWPALVKTRMTLVVYMGIARCAAIEAALLGAGLAASTPVLVVENASLPRERRLTTRLDRLAADVAAREIESPAVMVIGEVARLSGAAAAEAAASQRIRKPHRLRSPASSADAGAAPLSNVRQSAFDSSASSPNVLLTSCAPNVSHEDGHRCQGNSDGLPRPAAMPLQWGDPPPEIQMRRKQP